MVAIECRSYSYGFEVTPCVNVFIVLFLVHNFVNALKDFRYEHAFFNTLRHVQNELDTIFNEIIAVSPTFCVNFVIIQAKTT